MRRILNVLAVLALVAFAAPVMAQQEPSTGQDKPVAPEAGQQGVTQDTEAGAQPGVTERTATEDPGAATTETTPTETTEPTATETGGEMPTTASDLPTVLTAGLLLIALGVGFRYLRSRS